MRNTKRHAGSKGRTIGNMLYYRCRQMVRVKDFSDSSPQSSRWDWDSLCAVSHLRPSLLWRLRRLRTRVARSWFHGPLVAILRRVGNNILWFQSVSRHLYKRTRPTNQTADTFPAAVWLRPSKPIPNNSRISVNPKRTPNGHQVSLHKSGHKFGN